MRSFTLKDCCQDYEKKYIIHGRSKHLCRALFRNVFIKSNSKQFSEEIQITDNIGKAFSIYLVLDYLEFDNCWKEKFRFDKSLAGLIKTGLTLFV